MKLPPEIEFHADIRLLIYRPHGLMNEEAVNKLVSVIEDLEAEIARAFQSILPMQLGSPMKIELNFRYVIHVSLHRRLSYKGRAPVKSAILANDSTAHSLRPVACLTDSRFFDQCAASSKTAKKPRNGSVSRSNCWLRKPRDREPSSGLKQWT